MLRVTQRDAVEQRARVSRGAASPRIHTPSNYHKRVRLKGFFPVFAEPRGLFGGLYRRPGPLWLDFDSGVAVGVAPGAIPGGRIGRVHPLAHGPPDLELDGPL